MRNAIYRFDSLSFVLFTKRPGQGMVLTNRLGGGGGGGGGSILAGWILGYIYTSSFSTAH